MSQKSKKQKNWLFSGNNSDNRKKYMQLRNTKQVRTKRLQLMDMRDMGEVIIKVDSKISGFGRINRTIHWDKE